MNKSLAALRPLLFAASAALVTVAGCGGGGAADPGTSPAAGDTTSPVAGGTTSAGTGGSATTGADGATAGHAQHKRCGWIGADTFDAGKKSFLANPDYFDAIHPKWGTVMADGSIRMLSMANDAEIMAAAKQHNVKVIPLLDADDVSWLRSLMASPDAIATHAKTVTAFVVNNGYDGVELDYEHLWSAADRAPYTALISAVADALHQKGKVLTLALPAMAFDHKDAAYDYTQLQGPADVLHLMAYDYHYLGGDHLGPLAPKGWVSDVVTYVQSLGKPEKYSLGVANYGISSSWYTSARDAAARCDGGTHQMATDHMATCPLGHEDAGLAPHCTTPQGDVWFEDLASMKEKTALAKEHGLGGVAHYTIGDEPDGFFDAMKAQF